MKLQKCILLLYHRVVTALSHRVACKSWVLNCLCAPNRQQRSQQGPENPSDDQPLGYCEHELKSRLQQRFSSVSEGITKDSKPTLLNQTYTELYITEGEAGVNQEHEVRHIETAFSTPGRPETTITCGDIFKHPAHRQRPIRVVMTKGVAGVGKTVLTQKFSLDWADGRANQDIQLLFPFTFRELNGLRDRQFSLVGLLQHFFSESKGLCSLQHLQVVFIFDGLDECRPPLDFTRTRVLTKTTESDSVDVLLVNLIRGNLLPSAHLWMTTRPAAANQIPPNYISMVTEVRGFTDPQKEQYFRKRFRDEEATAVILHIKKTRVLHMMCYLPVFCWIISTVFDNLLRNKEVPKLPQTLTQMYIHFLVVQAKVKSRKYDGHSEMDHHWTPETRKMVESLGKLAFEQLQEGNLMFYESDLRQCDLEPTEASVYSGVFTQVFREEPGLCQDKVYCFIHLSVQEFLAGLEAHNTFFSYGVNLLSTQHTPGSPVNSYYDNNPEAVFYCSAVDQALQSPNGHLDLFLRFLLGLSLSTNQSLLRGLLNDSQRSYTTVRETVTYIETKISECQSAEQIVNLFYCLNELNDQTLVEKIQQNIREEHLKPYDLSPALWSAVTFLILSSDLEEFDLNKYYPSEEMFLKLLKVVKASNKALLSNCHLTDSSCRVLSSVLSSESSSLLALDLSYNPVKDSGVESLCGGLKSHHCRLETLSLKGCQLSEESCHTLASILSSEYSRLKYLDLSDNCLKDSGIKRLCSALKTDDCIISKLLLSNCDITDEGTASINSALKSGSPCLKVMDLCYNPIRRHTNVCLRRRLSCKTGIPLEDQRKYYHRLTLDPDTAHPNIKLCRGNRAAGYTGLPKNGFNSGRSSSPERFDHYYQVLCSNPLTGRCYWEVHWIGAVEIAVSYGSIRRKGDSKDCEFGGDHQSWSLRIDKTDYTVRHNNTETPLTSTIQSFSSHRVAVYVNCEVGTLSFFHKFPNGEFSHIHHIKTTFSQPLYAGFGLSRASRSVILEDVQSED